MSVTPERAREHLLFHANLNEAADIANAVIKSVNDQVNDREPLVATSLLARALILRGVWSIASEWYADVGRLPTPITFEVLMSLMKDPPPGVETLSWKDDVHGD